MQAWESVRNFARSAFKAIQPKTAFIEVAVNAASEKVAQGIKDEACAQAYKFMAQTHRSVVMTIVWQNAALLLSLVPVYLLHSAIPFYLAYALVAGYSAYSAARTWPFLKRVISLHSLTASISAEVLHEIEVELGRRQFYERKVVEMLTPDLKKIADEVAREIKPDLLAAAFNMALTLLMAFVAFRLFAIPMLEHRALGCG